MARVATVNGQLANVIALALHGSAWLDSPSGDAPDLDHSNSTFQYVRWSRFEAASRRWRQPGAFTSSRAWLSAMRDSCTRRLWLVIPEATPGPLEPNLVAGFSNGGN